MATLAGVVFANSQEFADEAPAPGGLSDRQQAHYYRAQHARAVQREQAAREQVRAGEKTVASLMVLLIFLFEQIADLKRQLAWLLKQLFGRKSEAQAPSSSLPASPAAAEGAGAEGAAEVPAPGAGEVVALAASGAAAGPGQRRRGQQAGAKGPKRRERAGLPEVIVAHEINEADRVCSCRGKVRPEIGLTEESQEIVWETRLVRKRHVRRRYGPCCACPGGQGIRTAPKPPKLIPKGLFAPSFWTQVLFKKFALAQPVNRTVQELRSYGLQVSPGTIAGGLQKINAMLQPLYGQFVLHAREGALWHMDETRWPMFSLVPGAGRELWWSWVVVAEEVTVFLFRPTRSSKVPREFFPEGTEGFVVVDRYAAYAVLKSDGWRLVIAYCWAHQRRDFVNVVRLQDQGLGWAEGWIELIAQLYRVNNRRREAWFKDAQVEFQALDREARQLTGQMKERLERELADPALRPEARKILRSMQKHWSGLTVFVDHPEVPMDNNTSERAQRKEALGRKNFYGSGARWSGELAAASYSIFATVARHEVCPRKYLQAYLEACARAGGQAPQNLDPFLPWKWTAAERTAWQTQASGP